MLEHNNALLSDLYRRKKEESLIESRLLEDLLSNFLPDGDIICQDIQGKAYAETAAKDWHS